MKKHLFKIAAIAAAMSLGTTPVMAQEVEDKQETVETVETVEETADFIDSFWNDALYGEYYGIEFEGDKEAALLYNKLKVFPGGIVNLDGNVYHYEIKGDDIVADIAEAGEFNSLTVTAKQNPVSLSEEKKKSFSGRSYMLDSGDLGIDVTVTYCVTDYSNPLAVKDVTYKATTTFVKKYSQDSLLSEYVEGKEWKTGDNTLKLNNGKIVLNGNSNAGTYSVYWNVDKYHAYIKLDWTNGAGIQYYVSDLTENSITLVNCKDEKEILEFTLNASAANAEEETEKTEE